MGKNVSGSIRKLTLDGVTYDVLGDANFSETGSGFESDAVPTSGDNIHKMTKRAKKVEGVVVGCNGTERDALEALADRTTDFPMSYETASGDVYRAQGWIEFENRETEENRASIQLHPRKKWTSFIAS